MINYIKDALIFLSAQAVEECVPTGQNCEKQAEKDGGVQTSIVNTFTLRDHIDKEPISQRKALVTNKGCIGVTPILIVIDPVSLAN